MIGKRLGGTDYLTTTKWNGKENEITLNIRNCVVLPEMKKKNEIKHCKYFVCAAYLSVKCSINRFKKYIYFLCSQIYYFRSTYARWEKINLLKLQPQVQNCVWAVWTCPYVPISNDGWIVHITKNAPRAAHKGLNHFPLRHRLPNTSLRQVSLLIGSAPCRLSKLFPLQALPVLTRGGPHHSRATCVRRCWAKEMSKTLEAISPNEV